MSPACSQLSAVWVGRVAGPSRPSSPLSLTPCPLTHSRLNTHSGLAWTSPGTCSPVFLTIKSALLTGMLVPLTRGVVLLSGRPSCPMSLPPPVPMSQPDGTHPPGSILGQTECVTSAPALRLEDCLTGGITSIRLKGLIPNQ